MSTIRALLKLRAPAPLRLALLLLLLVAPALHAQFENGSLVGTLRDASGAVVANAVVTVTNKDTGLVQTRTSSAAGDYEFPSLRLGTYRVESTLAGFNTAVADNVALSVGTRQRIDLTLQVAGSATTVEVSDVALQLETDSSQRGQIITHDQTVALPLVTRTYSSLVLLTTGTRQSSVGTGSSSLVREGSFNVEGQRSTFNNFLLDGLDNNAYGTSNQGFSNQVIQPSPDSIGQFQVVTNNESAEYGRSSGATVNVAFASGTNKLHLEAFEFLRNTAGNAIGFFALHDPITTNIVKPVLHRNDFGGNLGGPLLHDKAFFFLDYEGFRQTRNSFATLTIPTVAETQGLFPTSATTPACSVVKDPYTNLCVPAGTSIFADPNHSAAAQKIAGLFASLGVTPNIPGAAIGAANYETLVPFSDKLDKYDLRLDYQLSQKSSTFLRVSQQKENAFDFPALPEPLDAGTNGKQRIIDQQVALGYTRQIAANQLLDVRLGSSFTKGGKFTFGLGTASGASFGIPGLPDANPRVAGGLPTFIVTGLSAFGRQATNPQWQYPFVFNPKVNYTWVKGAHSFKFGYEYQRIHIVDQDVNPIDGRFSFQGNFTGGGNTTYGNYADFLFGAASKYEITNFFIAHMRQVQHFGYVQDDWKALPTLTLNLGLRYEYGTPYWDKDGNLTNFDPALSPASGSMLQAVKSGSTYQRTLVQPDRNDFAPRVGFAFAPDAHSTLRGGFGVSFIHFNRAGSGNELALNAPQVLFVVVPQTPTIPGGNLNANFRRLDQGFAANVTAPSSFNPLTDNITYMPKNYRDSYVESFFLAVQRQVAPNTILDLAYVGNHGLKLLEFANFNQINPSASFTRPFPSFGDITAALNSSYSNYNSLQFRFEQRAFHNLTLLNSFTWSRTFDNAAGSLENTNGNYPAPQDINNLRADYGPSNYDQPLTNVTSFVYDLPVGRGQRFAATAPWLVQQAIGGWQLSGISTFSSGQSLTALYSPAAVNQVSGISSDFRGANNYRPNRVPGATLYNSATATPVPNTLSYVQYLNAAAFTTPPSSTTANGVTTPLSPFGNASRNLAHSKVYNDTDLALSKNFLLTERARVQFRAEAFNVVNHTNFSAPSTTLGGSFGRITGTFPARILQLALKVTY